MNLGNRPALHVAVGMLVVLFVWLGTASASVTVLGYYRLGEDDPGAVAGTAGKNPTVDNTAGNNLSTWTAVTNSSDVSPIAAAKTGTTLSMLCRGWSGFYQGSQVTSPTTNFGLEAWVKPTTVSENDIMIAYNGSGGGSGFGLYQNATNFTVLYGGVNLWGSALATLNEWTHLAVVRDTVNSYLYVNGVLKATDATWVPNAPSGSMIIAPQGVVDEVRIFTFEGAFDPNDLLIPEPSMLALLALGVPFLWLVRRRFRGV
jgi:hypothetical protein